MVWRPQTDVDRGVCEANSIRMMPVRVAFVDLLFAWPPHGGANVDVYHVCSELQAMGCDVRLIALRQEGSWERGCFDEHALPFSATAVPVTQKTLMSGAYLDELRKAVDLFVPDVVIMANGFHLKPDTIHALSHYPIAARYYAYEMACHRSILRFRDGAPCPYDYANFPEECRRCALAYLRPEILRQHYGAWTEEYLGARAYAPDYYVRSRAALGQLDCAIVSNKLMADLMAPWCAQQFIIPGGVDIKSIPPPSPPAAEGPRQILATGRLEDPAKGLQVLLEAAEKLATTHSNFEVVATAPEHTPGPVWWKPVGWQARDAVLKLYKEAYVCVVPSIWDEPFGLVALEAMAAARPVLASRVGGLQDIVQHTRTGFLFERGDSAELARQLALMLDNEEMMREMGAAGRRRVEAHYTWPKVVAAHYPAVLEFLAGSQVKAAK